MRKKLKLLSVCTGCKHQGTPPLTVLTWRLSFVVVCGCGRPRAFSVPCGCWWSLSRTGRQSYLSVPPRVSGS